MSVTVLGPDGQQLEVDETQVQALADRGFRVLGADERAALAGEQARADYYSTTGQRIRAGAAGVARGMTFGISDAVGSALGAEDDLRALREYNAGESLGGELLGGLASGRALPTARLAKTAEGAGAGAKLLAAGKAGAAEGAAFGLGSGVTELSLSKDPVTLERAASVLSSHALFGAGVGGAAGAAFKGAELGLARARAQLDDIAARAAAPANVDDLAKLDTKGLRAAEKAERETLRKAERAEIERLSAAEKAELEALEQAKNLQRKEVADEIAKFRQSVKDEQHFLTTDGVKLPAVEGMASAAEIGRVAAKATRQLDNLLDNPAGLAARPERALDALQRHESAMMRLLDRADDLRTVFKADTSGARMKALDAIPAALERNRALQAKLSSFSAQPKSQVLDEIAAQRAAIQSGSMKTSQRLDDIAAARDVVSGGQQGGIVGQMLGGTVFSAVTGAVSTVAGGTIGALVGGAAAKFVNGGLAKAAAAQAERASKAVGAVLDVTKRVAPVAPVLATKTLSSVAYSTTPQRTRTLPEAYKARTEELKQLTQFDEMGNTVMRPAARAEMAKRLAPIRAVDEVLADRLESIAARKIEYLSSIIPRKPDVGGFPIGPDKWQPSSMQMRSFARSVAAVEDPAGVFERVAGGTVTPEDVDAVKNVYPEMYMDFQAQVFSQLPTLRKSMPYEKRLALSIFTGLAVDASMHPQVLGVLQASFNQADEQTAPTPQAQFGSVRAEAATPAQERAT